jgi:predicted ATPase
MMTSWLADMRAKSGENKIALSVIEQTLAQISDITGRAWEAELYRQRGEMLRSNDALRVHESESSLKEAIEVARRQSAKSLELRAATSLAELWKRQGRGEEARDLIERVYAWFTEGADTQDLKRAQDVQIALVNSDTRRLN